MLKTERIKEALFVVVLVVVTACIYLNTLDGEFVFDDSRIYNNPSVQIKTFSLTGLVHSVTGMEPSTRPVVNLTFVLNYLIHSFDVRGYHLTNLCIHIAVGVILYLFLRTTLTLPIWRNRYLYSRWTSFAAALIWLVHPLQTQAVSYIVQRMTSLCALFFIFSLFLYVRGRLAQSADKRFFLFCGSVLSCVLAMGSKENAVMLPFFILLYEWFFFQDLRMAWLLNNKKYLFGVGLLLVIVPLLFTGNEPWRVIIEGYGTRDFTLPERLLTEFRVIFLYLGLLVFPHPARLSLEHDVLLSTSLVNPITTLPAIAALLGAVVVALLMAPKYRLESFCILWFFGNHLVEGSILPLELVFEHRNYLPSMMAVFLLVIVVDRFITNRKMLFFLLCILVVVFSFWTYQRNFVWHDRVSLWRDCVEKAPNLARTHNNLAVALKSRGKFEEAIFHYRETIRLDPGFVEAYYNLGNIMMLKGNLFQAVQYYQQAVLLNPGLVVLRMSLANALFDSSRFHEAGKQYQQILVLEPANVEARMNLDQTTKMLNYLKKNTSRQAVP